MRLYGKCGKADPCHDRRHCNPWRGSRTRENREALAFEEAADDPLHPNEIDLALYEFEEREGWLDTELGPGRPGVEVYVTRAGTAHAMDQDQSDCH